MSYRFAALALRELRAQLAYLAAYSPEAASRLADEVELQLQRVDQGILEGPSATLRAGARVVRRLYVTPLLLFYVRQNELVVVIRVRHEAQRPIHRP